MKLIGKKVMITSKYSFYYGEWGTIIDYDGDYYHVAIANDIKSAPIFARNEFKLVKER